MDILSKTVVATVSLIGLLSGLLSALRGLISEIIKLRDEFSKLKHAKNKRPASGHAGKKTSPHKEYLERNDRTEPIVISDSDADRASSVASGERESTDDDSESVALKRPPLPPRLLRSPMFIVGLLLFILSAAGIAYLYHRTTLLCVRINRPASGRLDVTSDGKGSGLYSVAGDYNGGDLSVKGLGIFVLVRSEEAGDEEPWYVQGYANIDRRDTWYRQGEWSRKEASVGRDENAPLKPGEKWEIVAVLAPRTLAKGSTITPAQFEETGRWGAKSEISHVTVGDIAPAAAQPDLR